VCFQLLIKPSSSCKRFHKKGIMYSSANDIIQNLYFKIVAFIIPKYHKPIIIKYIIKTMRWSGLWWRMLFQKVVACCIEYNTKAIRTVVSGQKCKPWMWYPGVFLLWCTLCNVGLWIHMLQTEDGLVKAETCSWYYILCMKYILCSTDIYLFFMFSRAVRVTLR